jgi:hypothetical protein
VLLVVMLVRVLINAHAQGGWDGDGYGDCDGDAHTGVCCCVEAVAAACTTGCASAASCCFVLLVIHYLKVAQ